MACPLLLLALPAPLALPATLHSVRAEDGVPVRSVGEHATPVTHLVFAPKGDVLLLAGEDGTAHAVDPGEGPVQDLAFSPDGARLASVEGGAVRVRDLSDL